MKSLLRALACLAARFSPSLAFALGLSVAGSTSAVASGLTPALLWENHVAKALASGLQPRCLPRKVSHAPSVAYRGSVALFHGFTACPSQFDELSARLAEQGFDSYLFLLPGHGLRDRASPRASDSLVGAEDWHRYVQAAREANRIFERLPGIKLVGGLSAGGGVAMGAVALDPSLYDGAMLFAPYLTTAQVPQRAGITAAEKIPLARRKSLGWGKDCTANPDRVGYCDFRLDHLVALERMGRWITERFVGTRVAPKTKIQFVGVEGDNAVSNDRTLYTLAHSRFKSSACRLRQMPHPFFVRSTPGESPSRQLDAFFSRMEVFARALDFWPTVGSGTSEESRFEFGVCSLSAVDQS